MKTAMIFNPHAGGGRAARRWPEIQRLLGPVETRRTEAAGHAIELARELIGRGFERIIAAGGDGTVHEVANGFLHDDRPVNPAASLGVLPLGTGGDFRRSLGIPKDFRDAIAALGASRPMPIDVGKASFAAADGSRRSRYFVNLTSFGMGGEVAARAGNFLTPLGGTIAYLYASAISLLRYDCKPVRLRLDDDDAGAAEPALSIYNVAVGNGRFHGGGMQACPTAVLDDGVFEVTVIRCMRLLEVLKDFPVLYSDNVYRHPKIEHLRASRLRAESDQTVRIEVDGEPLGALPLEIALLPRVLPVLVPRGGWGPVS